MKRGRPVPAVDRHHSIQGTDLSCWTGTSTTRKSRRGRPPGCWRWKRIVLNCGALSLMGSDQTNRRREHRRRSFKAGKIVSLNLTFTFDCTVRDFSSGGARVQIENSLAVPAEFFFIFPSDGLVARSKIAWRRQREIGIQYLEPLTPTKLYPNPLLAQMRL
jgi:hypothetical protein